MTNLLQIASYVLGTLILLGILYCWLRTSREGPMRLVVKWLLSLLVIVFVFVPIGPRLTSTGYEGAFLVPFIAAGGVMLALIWTPTVVNWISSKVETLFTGGDTPPEPHPTYDAAMAHRKQNRWPQAIQAIQTQLERFPQDCEGQWMMAEIYAENLHDLPQAREIIDAFCLQPGRTPGQIAYALDRMADWYVKLDHDLDQARQCWSLILERFPNTSQAELAAQRLAHLNITGPSQSQSPRRPIPVPAGVRNIGLLKNSASLRPAEENPDQIIARLEIQLDSHPRDWESRELLAVQYARHYKDLAMATEQLEMLLHQPTATLKQQARWLNLLADLQLEAGQSEEVVRQTLERILTGGAGSVWAEQARQRLSHLKLALRGREESRVLPLRLGVKAPREPGEQRE